MDDPDCPDISFFMLTFRTGVGMIIGLRFGPGIRPGSSAREFGPGIRPGNLARDFVPGLQTRAQDCGFDPDHKNHNTGKNTAGNSAPGKDTDSMFLMIGISQGRKDLSHDQLVICSQCGRYGHYRVFMTFTQLLLFLIPCFKWGKKYYVQMSCCGTVYSLNPEIGARIARGENVQIGPADLQIAHSGGGPARMVKRCSACGYQTEEDFDFCPKCGKPLS